MGGLPQCRSETSMNPTRSLLLASCLLGSVLQAPLTAAAVSATHQIHTVTVYPDRALITRRSTVSLPTGEHQVIFDNLPIRLN